MTNKSIFEHLSISPELNSAIAALGFEEATPIQAQAIPIMLQGRDIIGQAQTGTGKTIAYGVPLIQAIDETSKLTQAIVLCPTRELAIQVAEEFGLMLKHKRSVHVVPIYGGQPIDKQFKAMRKGAQIIIATPGRLIDHLQRKTVNLSQTKVVVLDEADVMLDMGFRDDIEIILKTTPKEKQTALFSATMSPIILQLTKKYLKDPEHVKVVHKELTVPNIEQHYIEIKPGMKLEGLTRLLDVYDPKLSLVFCNTKRVVDDLVKHLHTRGYLAEALHGDMKQSKRDSVMKKFRSGQIDILVATDVAARGLDVDEIDAVFNYDMPQDEEYYVHRIGRTARAGRVGIAYSFVTGKDIYKIRDIERYTKTKIVNMPLPKAEEAVEKKSEGIIEDIRKAIGDGKGMAVYEKFVLELMNEDFTTLEIAAGLVKMLMKGKEELSQETVSKQIKFVEEKREHSDYRKDKSERYGKDKSDRYGKEKSDRYGKDKSDRYGKEKSDRYGKDKTDRYGKDKSDRYGKEKTDRYGKDKSDRYGKEKSNRYGKEKSESYSKEPKKEKAEHYSETHKENKSSGDSERLFLNLGKKSKLNPKDMLRLFTKDAKIPEQSIIEVDMYDKFSFVEVEGKFAEKAINAIDGMDLNGKHVAIEIAKKK